MTAIAVTHRDDVESDRAIDEMVELQKRGSLDWKTPLIASLSNGQYNKPKQG